jgi:hypothetical protein
MAAFGQNPFPRRFGGGTRAHIVALNAMLDDLSDVFDVTDDSPIVAEVMGAAVAVATIWALNGRLRGGLDPTRMLETLTTWEQATRSLPTVSDPVHIRRARVAAKLRGLLGNTPTDIADTARAIAGSNFVTTLLVPTVDEVTYWPGVNPGPPGFEWSSNRAVVCVQLQRGTLNDGEFTALRSRVFQALDPMLPVWMRAVIGEGSSFICSVGIVGETLI